MTDGPAQRVPAGPPDHSIGRCNGYSALATSLKRGLASIRLR